MKQKIDLSIDVTNSAAWPESFPQKITIAATVCLPEPEKIVEKMTILFAFPGGGYSRHYFDMDLSHLSGCEQESYSQVDHHLGTGMIVVTCDHLCVGESTIPENIFDVTLELLAAANASAVAKIKQGLRDGSLIADVPAIPELRSVGIGQSMGGAITIATQADHASFDAIAVLAFGVYGSVAVRAEDIEELADHGTPAFADMSETDELPSMQDLWFQSDVPQSIIEEDTKGGYPVRQTAPPYGSLTIPPCAINFISPGFLNHYAQRVDVPVLLGYGDSDVLAEPLKEPGAYPVAACVDVVEIDRMGHMHNFASSRKRLWEELDSWAEKRLG